MKKILFRSLIILVVIGILTLTLLPGITKNYIVNRSKELIGRQINIEKFKYNYFTSTVKIYNFKMLEENEKESFVSFDTLIVNLESLQLFKNKIEIEDFYLKGLDVKIIMKDSTYNFDDLVDFHIEKDSITKNTEKDSYKYSLSNINIAESDFHFNNQDIEHTTNIENLSFLVPYIGWNQEEKSNADVKFNFPRGGYFESKFNINPINGEYDATININDLYLDPFYKYVVKYAEINSFNGIINSKIKIMGNTNEAIKSIVSGTVKVNNFIATDENDKVFVSAKEANATIKKLDYFNSSYVLDSFTINDSYTFFQLDSITNNFIEIFNTNNDKPFENKAINAKDSIKKSQVNKNDLYYAINHLEVNRGVLDYTDNLTGNPFNYHLSDIEIDTDSILSDANWIDLYSTMLLNKRGTLKAKFGFNPSNLLSANLDVSVENFLLPDINIYTNYYMGHRVLEGDLFYYSNSKISNGNIKSENNLLIKNVSLNNTKKGLYSLPLKFALFLLTDKNGDVNLDIPVRGDLNDPTVNVKKLVWSAFKNLIVKVATSPGSLLAGLVDGDPNDLEKITFNYLDTIPSDKNREQLDKLLELEQKKKDLKIELVYYVDKQLQKEAIAESQVAKMYLTETGKDYLKDSKEFESYLLEKTSSDSLDTRKAYLTLADPKYVDSIANNNSELLMTNVTKYLQMAQDSTQIKVIQSDPFASENTGTAPIFKVNFYMQSENDTSTNNSQEN